MTDRELLQQALNELENYETIFEERNINKIISAIKDRLAQPQKEWAGLTYDDMIKVWNELYKGDDVLPTTFGMAIEAKLKEKNT
jgi:hypothetical protein